jgi:dTDP-4-amino-4,6-dideoxygalactose transaminase
MPGWELVGKEEKKEINDIFNLSNGVMMAHGFEDVRNNYYRVRSFEDKIKKKLKVNYCLATTSGTMAQYIAMKALGVKPGDEVITQAFTFIATIEAILALGAKPKIVNIDETYNMCLCDLKNKITRKTKLVIPVPMLGNQCRVNEIKKICSNYNIKILEDACESLGAKIYNKYVGTNSNIGVYSLDYAKTITTGEGGLIVTNNQILYNFCKEFHDHGHVNDGKIPRGLEKAKIPGLNLRMTEMQAAFGLAQLKKLDYIVSQKNFLQNDIGDNKKNLESILHHIGLTTPLIKTDIENLVKAINKDSSKSELIAIVKRISSLNEKITSFSKYFKKVNFNIYSNELDIDIVSFTNEYLENVYRLRDDLRINRELLNVKISSPKDFEFKIKFNPIDLVIVLDNLISNSSKNGASKVELDWSKTANSVKLSFRDDGKGINDNIIENIFDFGFTTSRRGSGIGLYHVKEIVEKLNGKIEVNNQINKGVEFNIFFKK